MPDAYKDAERFALLRGLSKRIGALLNSALARTDQPVQACLDDLLGAVYSLFFAVHLDFDPRPQALEPGNVRSVLDRAQDMAKCTVRTEGKWSAGFYLNSSLFRIDETVTGESNKKFEELLACADESFNKWRGTDWQKSKLKEVNDEARRLKHREVGLIAGRKVEPGQALDAIGELLTLLEAYDSNATSKPTS